MHLTGIYLYIDPVENYDIERGMREDWNTT